MEKLCVRCGELLPPDTPHFCGPEQTVMLALLARAEKAEAELQACHKERVWALNRMTEAQMECGRLRAELAAYRAQVERETLERIWAIFPYQSQSNEIVNGIRAAIEREFSAAAPGKPTTT